MSKRFGSTPSDGALSFGGDEESTFRENLDPEQLVRLQINRCNVARNTGDEVIFNNNVLGLLSLIPQRKRLEIEDRKSEYTKSVDDYEYQVVGGWKLGTPENPVYRNLPMDLDYDPTLKQVTLNPVKKKDAEGNEYDDFEEIVTYGEPVLVSPIKVSQDIVDYSHLFTIIIAELENLKMWFRIEEIMVDGGDWEIEEKKEIPPPNPTPPPWPVKEKTEDEPDDEP